MNLNIYIYNMKYTTILFKNKRIVGNDSKLVDILSSSMIQNKHHFLKANNHTQEGLQKAAVQILESFFSNQEFTITSSKKVSDQRQITGVLISNPIFHHGANKIYVQLFYYFKNNNSSVQNLLSEKNVKAVCKALSLVFKKEVHIEMTRVRYPYMNAQILAKYLVMNGSKKNFLKFADAVASYPSYSIKLYGMFGEEDSFVLPSYIQGIRLELAGRLTTERLVPRITNKSVRINNPNADSGVYLQKSGVSNDTVRNIMVDYGKYTGKNALGTFTMKV